MSKSMLTTAFKTKTNKSIEAALAGHIKPPEGITTFDELSYVFKKSNEQIALRFDIKSLIIILFKPLQYIQHRIRMRRLQDAAIKELASNFMRFNRFTDLNENMDNEYKPIIQQIARMNMTDEERAAMIGDLVGRYAQKQWHEQKSYIAFAIEECYFSAVNSASYISILEMFFSRSFLSKFGIYIKDTKTPMQVLKALVQHSKRSEKGQCKSEFTISSCEYLIENIDKDILFTDINFLADLFSFFGKHDYIMQLMNAYIAKTADTTVLSEVIETLYSNDKAIPEVLFDYSYLDTHSCMVFFARIAENIPQYIFHQIKHNQNPHYLFSLIKIYSEKSWEDDRYKNLLYDIYLKYNHLFYRNQNIYSGTPPIRPPRHLIRLNMDDPESKFDTYNNYLAHFLYHERYEAMQWRSDFYCKTMGGYLNLSTEDCIKITINEPFSCLEKCLDLYTRTHQDLYAKKFLVFAEVLIRFNFNCWSPSFGTSHIPKQLKYDNVMYRISNLLVEYRRTMLQDQLIDRLIKKYIRLLKLHFDECKKMNQNSDSYFDEKLFSRLTVPLTNTKPKCPPDTHASSIPSNTPPPSNASSDTFTHAKASDTCSHNRNAKDSNQQYEPTLSSHLKQSNVAPSNQHSSFFKFSKAKLRNTIGMENLEGDYKNYNNAINHLKNGYLNAAKKSISKISRKFFYDTVYNRAANDKLLKILSHKNINKNITQSILGKATLNKIILDILHQDIVRISVDYNIANLNVKSNQQLGSNITGGVNVDQARQSIVAFKEAKKNRDEELLKYKNSDLYKNMLLLLKLDGVIDHLEYEPKDLHLHISDSCCHAGHGVTR